MRRRRTRRRGRAQRILAFGLVLAGCFIYVRVSRHLRVGTERPRRATYVAETPVRPASTQERPRAVYPYSVLKGGAWSRTDLAERLARDPVAAAHYRDFKVPAVRVGQLDAPQLAYVSYRVDNTVYWTRSPVLLPAGETVLTDGESLARARCGNRLSTRALAPVGPDVDLDDPPEVDLAGLGRDAGPQDIFSDRPLLVHDLMSPLVEEGRESEAAAAVTAAPGVNGAAGVAAVSPTPTGAASTELTQSFLPGGGWIRGTAGGPALWAPPGNVFPGNLPPPAVFGELPSMVSLLPYLPVAGRFPPWSEIVNQFYPVPLTSSGLQPVPFVLPPFNSGGLPITAGKIGLTVPAGGLPAPPGGLPGTEPPAGPGPPPGGPPTPPPSATEPPGTTPPFVPSGPPPVDTPEPGTMLLILGGAALGLAIRRVLR